MQARLRVELPRYDAVHEPRNPATIRCRSARCTCTRRVALRSGTHDSRHRAHMGLERDPAQRCGLVRAGIDTGVPRQGHGIARPDGHAPRWLRDCGHQQRRVRPCCTRARGRRFRHPLVHERAGFARHVPDLGISGQTIRRINGCHQWHPATPSDASALPSRTLAPMPPRCGRTPSRMQAATGSSTDRRCGSPTGTSRMWPWCGHGQTTAPFEGSWFRPMSQVSAATPVKGKMSLRASNTAELVLANVRLPADAVLPGVASMRGPLSCLSEARFGIVWGVTGCSTCLLRDGACICHGAPCLRRPDRPSPADATAPGRDDGARAEGLSPRASPRKDEGSRSASPLPRSRSGRWTTRGKPCGWHVRPGRLLGANGITLDYPPIRHMMNLESVYTYEGTNEIHQLILGQAITGHNAFGTG